MEMIYQNSFEIKIKIKTIVKIENPCQINRYTTFSTNYSQLCVI